MSPAKMSPGKNLRPLLVAACAASFALASAFGTAAEFRRRAQRTSHQQPTEERWFESRAPASPALLAHGRELYLASCAHCHAADATGDEGPDLHGVQVSDRYIAAVIAHGIEGEMPSFAKKLHAPEITALIAYVRSLK